MSVYDQDMANRAAAVDHALKLGGVILKPPSKPSTGFAQPSPPRPQTPDPGKRQT